MTRLAVQCKTCGAWFLSGVEEMHYDQSRRDHLSGTHTYPKGHRNHYRGATLTSILVASC
jgi:hypothetical protein